MATDDLLTRFQSCASIYRSSRVSKFRQGHLKLLYSKTIEIIARVLRIGIERKAKLFWGDEMTVIYPEPTSLAASRYGFYEEGLTAMVLQYLKPGMTFLDVGAHVGYFTLLAGWLVGITGQVHSFEPTYRTFEVLRSNSGGNSNTYLNQVAIASETGNVTVNDYGPAFSGYNSIYRARMPETTLRRVRSTSFQATAISIDEYVLHEQLRPDFIKIDAESAEYDILKGMEDTIQRFRPMISMEVGDMDIEGIIECRDLVMYLKARDYHAYEFNEGEIIRHELKERYEYDNILFLPYNGNTA